METEFVSYFQNGLGNLELLAKGVTEGFLTGLHKSPFHGFSVEFAEHRPYNTGEDTRHVDWRLYARTDRLFMKKYSEETNMRCHLLLDRSSSMFFPSVAESPGGFNKLRFAIGAAASLGYLLYKQRDALSLNAFSDELTFASECKSGAVHWHYLMDRLSYWYEQAEQPAGGRRATDIVPVLHLLAEKMHKRSMVVVFSDMFDRTLEAMASADGDGALDMEAADRSLAELREALQHLRYRQHEVLLFHVQSRGKEAELQYGNRPYRFVDMETGEEVRVNPHYIREAYVERLTRRQDALKRLCESCRTDYIPAYIEDGFVPVLQSYLSKRKIKR
ncbi:MAG: DUF58 domain-containing protein [Bacteroidales bacterium]|nr:DUF58 domain-containing protein [Bacteroidales bacterium]